MHYRLLTFFLLSLLFAVSATAQDFNRPTGAGKGSKTIPIEAPGSITTLPPSSAGTLHSTEKSSASSVTDDKEKPKALHLDSYAFDTMTIKNRIFIWQVNRYLNTPVLGRVDTTINAHRSDFIYRKDIGATFLGVSGSAAVTMNYFQRTQHEYMYALTPFNNYFTTPDNIYFYNTRSPYTRFTYSGNPFSNQQFEELNLEALHTQNITPEWNAGIRYNRLGGNGLLANEATDNRTFSLFTSYSGRRYFAQAGYIYNGSKNNQNGGVTKDSYILDTTMDVRTIPVNLANAKEIINTNTFFLIQSYGVPLNFLHKKSVADSLGTGEGSIVYFGNSLEYTNTKRIYKDNITDSTGSAYYNNIFNIDPSVSNDSIHTTLFDARLFMSLQPFAPDFIISKITGGIGYRYLSNYCFNKSYYLRPISNNTQNNFFLYADAQGNFKQYFAWSAFARYYFVGYNQNDLFFNANASLSFFPLKHGIHLWGSFTIENRTPDYFLQHYYSNHLQWENNFDKTIETKIEAGIRIPDWQLNIAVGNSLLKSPIFFNTSSVPQQSDEIVNILAISIEKNFKAWLMHFDNRVLIQHSSAQDIIPLPTFALNSAIYLEVEAVKNVLTAQIGGDIYYNTKYYAYAYNPAAGAFHVQNNREIGNCPGIDAFLNLKWKRATIFVKLVNAAQGWPDSDYFSALHYIKPQRVLKFGISWPFYL